MLGFDTIGNATVTCYDGKPVLSTDPWISGHAYFGSWYLPYEIPSEQMDNIINSEYIWISHGHPDHLSAESLEQLTHCKFLLSDHVGKRIYNSFVRNGLNVRILPDRKWYPISNRIKVMGIGDYHQDSILLIDIAGTLVVNTNDAMLMENTSFIRRIIKQYDRAILLKLFGYGDVDMLNCFNEDGSFIKTTAHYNKEKGPLGPQIKFWSELYGVSHVVPFSCFHDYQRTDSVWARDITTPVEAMYRDFDSKSVELLPFYIRYDCETHRWKRINPARIDAKPRRPEEFGDDWSQPLERDDEAKLRKYFGQFEVLPDYVDYLQFTVGARTHTIELNKKGDRGINFHVPRNSLMTCVEHEVLDDLLIGNFMRTTFLGRWRRKNLSFLNTYITKYGDNGLARTREEVKRYLDEYRRRAPIEFLFHRMGRKSEQMFRAFVSDQSRVFSYAKKVYAILR